MAIQFLCPACRQPIEVDDDAANQTVTCPYCQKVVTAPAQSDQGIRPQPYDARPSDRPTPSPNSFGSNAISPPPPVPGEPHVGNKLGYASLICMVVCLVSMATMLYIATSAIGDLKSISDPKEVQKRMMQALSERPALATAYVAALVGVCGVPIVGAVLAIISLAKRRTPRWPAIVALCLLGAYMIMVCLNLVGAMAGLQKPA